MKSIWRVLGFIHQIQPGCILLELVKIIFEAVQPYIPLYFSGLMVSAVIAGERTAAERLDWARGICGDSVKYFADSHEMITSGEIDAIMIATPH